MRKVRWSDIGQKVQSCLIFFYTSAEFLQILFVILHSLAVRILLPSVFLMRIWIWQNSENRKLKYV